VTYIATMLIRKDIECASSNPAHPMETFMKLLLASMLLLSVSACALDPMGGGGKAGGDTVVVCHKGKKTLELPSSAADAHLGHGDTRGRC
jgi:hypothetical protein